jgi:hypothetical protein
MQRLHSGFCSSHLIRRALQVMHPVRDLGLPARFLFCLGTPRDADCDLQFSLIIVIVLIVGNAVLA